MPHHYLRDPQPPESPLFVGHDGTPLLCTDLIQQLHEDLAQLGFQPSQFSSHSFWRGGASSAAAAGSSDFELQQLGQWHSDAYKLYVEPNKDHLLSLSAHFHWAVVNLFQYLMVETAKIIFYSSRCLYVALDYIIDVRESLSHGNLGTCWQSCHELGCQRVKWHKIKGQR